MGVGVVAGTFQHACTLINEREGYANFNTSKVALTQRTHTKRDNDRRPTDDAFSYFLTLIQ